MKRMIIFTAVMVLAMILNGTVFAKTNDEGFIYGKIITRGGDEYLGIIRWAKQEYFWDDLFNATKEKNEWLKFVDRHDDRRTDIRIFGKSINIPYAGTHQFVTRFGDIKSIDTRRGDDAILEMKNGTEYKVSGYGDVGAILIVLDQNLGKVKLKWDNIETIEFMETPKSVNKPGYRLYGKVETRVMEFEGWVMWDAEECISSDVLDGETMDGDMEIEFGNIRSIERRSSSSCKVTLKDGRDYVLRGSNDVDDDNRGIYVEDKRFGKIEISWDEFDKVTYIEKDDSGDPYGIYKPTGKLKGTVDVYRIGEVKGEIVFDLDESEGFEILDGRIDDIDLYIPMRQILSITPKGRHSSKVILINGEELILEDTQDVSASNDGVLIFSGKDEPQYHDWDEIEEIRFDHK